MVDVMAHHGDTSISMTVFGVSSQSGTHITQVTLAPDNTTNHTFENLDIIPSHIAQDSSKIDTNASRQDHSQSQQPIATSHSEPDSSEAVTTGSHTGVLSLTHIQTSWPGPSNPVAFLARARGKPSQAVDAGRCRQGIAV